MQSPFATQNPFSMRNPFAPGGGNVGYVNPQVPPLTDQEYQDFTDKLLEVGGSTLQHVGGFLEKMFGGRAVKAGVGMLTGVDKATPRDFLSIIPGSDVVGLTDRQDAVQGGDIVESMGFGSTGNKYLDIARDIGVDLALDPGMWVTPFPKTPGAIAAEAIGGRVPNAAKSALKLRAGMRTKVAESVAERAKRFEMLTGEEFPAVERFTDYAKEMFSKYTPEELLEQPMRHLVGIGLPFGKPMASFGSGAVAQRIAAPVDWLADHVRWSWGGRVTSSLFNAKSRGIWDQEGQIAAAESWLMAEEGRAFVRGEVSDAFKAIDDASIDAGIMKIGPDGKKIGHSFADDPKAMAQLGYIWEHPGKHLDDLPYHKAFDDIAAKQKATIERLHKKGMQLGLPSGWLDEGFDYRPRTLFNFGIQEPMKAKQRLDLFETLDTNSLNIMSTHPFLTAWKLGRSGEEGVARNSHEAVRFILKEFFGRERRFVGEGKKVKRFFHDWGAEDGYEAYVRNIKMKVPVERALAGKTVNPSKEIEDFFRESWGLEPQQVMVDVGKGQQAPAFLYDVDDMVRHDEGGMVEFLKNLDDSVKDHDQARRLADYIGELDPDHFNHQVGIFGRHILEDMEARLTLAMDRIVNANAVQQLYGSVARPVSEMIESGDEYARLGDALSEAGFSMKQKKPPIDPLETGPISREVPATRSGEIELTRRLRKDKPLFEEGYQKFVHGKEEIRFARKEYMRGWGVPKKFVDDAKRLRNLNVNPQMQGVFLRTLDSLTNMWKAAVTTPFIPFHIRNFTTIVWQNFVEGAFDSRVAGGAMNPWAWAKPYMDARKLMKGQIVEDAHLLPIFRGRGLSAAQASDELRSMMYRRRITGPGTHLFTEDVPTSFGGMRTTTPVQDFAQQVRAGHREGEALSFMPHKILGRLAKPDRSEGATSVMRQYFDPTRTAGWKTSGTGGPVSKAFKGTGKDEFIWFKEGRRVGEHVEDVGRTASMLGKLSQGVDEAAAAAATKMAHVNYEMFARSDFEKNVMKRVAPFYTFCVPKEDHEILTRRGWKKCDDLVIGEDVLAMDHKSGELRWTPVEDVNEFDIDQEIFEYSHSKRGRVTSFRFTKDHSWPVITRERDIKHTLKDGTKTKYRVGGLRKMVKGHSLTPEMSLLCSGEFADDGAESVLSPRLAAILGWVVTDGYFRVRGSHMEMLVYQSPKKHLNELLTLLGTKPRKPHPDSGVVPVPVAIEDVKAIREHFESLDDLCRIVGRLSHNAAMAMKDAMFKAEGSTSKNGQRFFAQEKAEVRDAFQMLCLMAGESANLCERGCTIKKSGRYKVAGNVHPVHFRGKVWCPTTKYGTWVMRHNGSVVITGNTRGMIPYQLRQIIMRPNGPVALAVRAAEKSRQQQGYLPDWIANSLAIPLGQNPATGETRYLTNLDLPHEPVLNELFKPGPTLTETARRTGMGILSQTNPLFKVPAEMMTGMQFFTGRRLEDVDSPTGRIIQNVTGMEEPPEVPVALDQFIQASPFARLQHMARTVTDPRKREGPGGSLGLAFNALTGFRVSDVNTEALKDRAVRNTIASMVRGRPYVRSHENLYVRKEDLEKLPPKTLQLIQAQKYREKQLTERAKQQRMMNKLTGLN